MRRELPPTAFPTLEWGTENSAQARQMESSQPLALLSPALDGAQNGVDAQARVLPSSSGTWPLFSANQGRKWPFPFSSLWPD